MGITNTFFEKSGLITSVGIVLVFLVVFPLLVPPLTPDGSARGGGTQDHRLSCGGWAAVAQGTLPEAKDA